MCPFLSNVSAGIFHIESRKLHQLNVSLALIEGNLRPCNIIADIVARKNVFRSEGRCFICLDHVARNCTSDIKCHECDQGHHISVCTQITNTSLSGATSNTSFAGTTS